MRINPPSFVFSRAVESDTCCPADACRWRDPRPTFSFPELTAGVTWWCCSAACFPTRNTLHQIPSRAFRQQIVVIVSGTLSASVCCLFTALCFRPLAKLNQNTAVLTKFHLHPYRYVILAQSRVYGLRVCHIDSMSVCLRGPSIPCPFHPIICGYVLQSTLSCQLPMSYHSLPRLLPFTRAVSYQR